MRDATELVAPEAVIATLKAGSKKQALQELAQHAAAQTGLTAEAVFQKLLEREKLGSTGVGGGVAIPHGKFPELASCFGMFARLERGVDFDAVDDQPVDLIFVLLAPERPGSDHLKALARVARLLRDRLLCDKLRGSTSADALYALLSELDHRNAA